MKNLLLLFICITFTTSAQNRVTLKKPLTKADTTYLINLAKESIDIGGQFNLQYASADGSYTKPKNDDKPFDIADVQKLNKKLKGTYEDAPVYYDIADLYKNKFDMANAKMYFDKSLEMAKLREQTFPDSASSYFKTGNVYFKLDQYKNAAEEYVKGLTVDPKDTVYNFYLPGIYMYMYDFKTAMNTIQDNIKKYPHNSKSYEMLPLYYFLEPLQNNRNFANTDLATAPGKIKERFLNKPASVAVDLSLIKTGLENNKDDKKIELLYKFSLLNAVIVKVMSAAMLDTNSTEMKFPVDEYDKADLKDLETFFKKRINDPSMKNNYAVYKSLAYLEMTGNNTSEAISYFKQAIKAKEAQKKQYEYNAASDYDNLAGAYIILHDTASFEQTIKAKFIAKPSINPNPEDYINMAKLAFHHKDYENAKQYLLQSLEIYPLTQAYSMLATMDIMENDNNAALADLNKGYKVDNNDGQVQYLSGICLLMTNDASTAYQCFKTARESMDSDTIDKEVINYFFNVKP